VYDGPTGTAGGKASAMPGAHGWRRHPNAMPAMELGNQKGQAKVPAAP